MNICTWDDIVHITMPITTIGNTYNTLYNYVTEPTLIQYYWKQSTLFVCGQHSFVELSAVAVHRTAPVEVVCTYIPPVSHVCLSVATTCMSVAMVQIVLVDFHIYTCIVVSVSHLDCTHTKYTFSLPSPTPNIRTQPSY